MLGKGRATEMEKETRRHFCQQVKSDIDERHFLAQLVAIQQEIENYVAGRLDPERGSIVLPS
jgi:hypothetical protein